MFRIKPTLLRLSPTCWRIQDHDMRIELLQAQGSSQTRQRIFEIQLRAPKDGKMEGTILMPFGMKCDSLA
jgi:hypothetical protein